MSNDVTDNIFLEGSIRRYSLLDAVGKSIAQKLSKGEIVTHELLIDIKNLYNSEKLSTESFYDEMFKSAYHPPVTADLEFLISRILYHYSNLKDLGWKICLRVQKEKAVPDIRIERSGKTIAVVELSARAGWFRPLFSDIEASKVPEKAKKLISERKVRFKKYKEIFKVDKKSIFFILPTMQQVHKKREPQTLNYYRRIFGRNAEIDKGNLIIFSGNPSLALSENPAGRDFEPTNDFENFVKRIERFK